MGLDIKFNLALAKKAGLTVTKERNGTDEQIKNWVALQKEHLQYFEYDGTDFLTWLNEYEDVGRLPDYEYAFIVDTSVEGYAIVRANKWGNLYAPLTEFLKNNNITWEEY